MEATPRTLVATCGSPLPPSPHNPVCIHPGRILGPQGAHCGAENRSDVQETQGHQHLTQKLNMLQGTRRCSDASTAQSPLTPAPGGRWPGSDAGRPALGATRPQRLDTETHQAGPARARHAKEPPQTPPGRPSLSPSQHPPASRPHSRRGRGADAVHGP